MHPLHRSHQCQFVAATRGSYKNFVNAKKMRTKHETKMKMWKNQAICAALQARKCPTSEANKCYMTVLRHPTVIFGFFPNSNCLFVARLHKSYVCLPVCNVECKFLYVNLISVSNCCFFCFLFLSAFCVFLLFPILYGLHLGCAFMAPLLLFHRVYSM